MALGLSNFYVFVYLLKGFRAAVTNLLDLTDHHWSADHRLATIVLEPHVGEVSQT